jgi:hypothetical protein
MWDGTPGTNPRQLLMVFSTFQLYNTLHVCATWAALDFSPTWPFHVFTNVFLADVTSTESGLVCHSFLNYYFHRAYK